MIKWPKIHVSFFQCCKWVSECLDSQPQGGESSALHMEEQKLEPRKNSTKVPGPWHSPLGLGQPSLGWAGAGGTVCRCAGRSKDFGRCERILKKSEELAKLISQIFSPLESM